MPTLAIVQLYRDLSKFLLILKNNDP